MSHLQGGPSKGPEVHQSFNSDNNYDDYGSDDGWEYDDDDGEYEDEEPLLAPHTGRAHMDNRQEIPDGYSGLGAYVVTNDIDPNPLANLAELDQDSPFRKPCIEKGTVLIVRQRPMPGCVEPVVTVNTPDLNPNHDLQLFGGTGATAIVTALVPRMQRRPKALGGVLGADMGISVGASTEVAAILGFLIDQGKVTIEDVRQSAVSVLDMDSNTFGEYLRRHCLQNR